MITVYSKPDCHLCAEAMTTLRALKDELGFVLEERDITAEEALHRAYFERIPCSHWTERSCSSTSSTRRCCESV
jgi:hypothetical protein